MHWAHKLAEEVIKRNPNKEEYVCAAGISPSGSVHIGNFRDIATSYYVVKALRKMGKKARLLFSWDEFDRLRKVPSNVAPICPDFDKYLGMPFEFPTTKMKITELKLGRSSRSHPGYYDKYYNENLTGLNIGSSCPYLQHLNIARCKSLTTVDLSACTRLMTVDAEQCENLTSITFPEDSILQKLYLPGKLSILTLKLLIAVFQYIYVQDQHLKKYETCKYDYIYL